jgi:hypothetical protein
VSIPPPTLGGAVERFRSGNLCDCSIEDFFLKAKIYLAKRDGYLRAKFFVDRADQRVFSENATSERAR